MKNTQIENRSLLHPQLDFWCLGGLSIAFWAVLKALTPFRGQLSAIESHITAIPATFITLSIVSNYPHFMASYKLAYGQGTKFVAKNWFQLLFVPVTLILLAASFVFNHVAVANALFLPLNKFLSAVGSATQFGSRPADIISLGANVMFFTVGWHYAKQTFGCVMVSNALAGKKMDLWPRRVLRANLLSLWAVNFFNANLSPADPNGKFMDIPFYSLHLPVWMMNVSWVCFTVTAVGCLYFVTRGRFAMSKEAWVSVAAFFLWYIPFFMQPEFTYHSVPFFHSLQYLCFVARLERNRNAQLAPERAFRKFFLVGISLVAAGYAAFEIAPQWLDARVGTPSSVGFWFFFVTATLFINIHHYFIDNVLWRFDNSEMRMYLLPSKKQEPAREAPGEIVAPTASHTAA